MSCQTVFPKICGYYLSPLIITLGATTSLWSPFEIILLQTTKKENNWKTEVTLERAVVTLETERIKGSNPWCLWWWWWVNRSSHSVQYNYRSTCLISIESEGSYLPSTGCWQVLSPTRKETSSEACQGRAWFQQHWDARFHQVSSSLQGKAPKEIQAILTETLACFLPGRVKNFSARLYLAAQRQSYC